MDQAHSEAGYPINFREEDAKKLGEQIRYRNSIEFVGVKRVGISNFLRFFLYHKSIVSTYINHGEHHLFIPVDLNDLVEREIFPFWILTFKRLVDSVENSNLTDEIKKEIEHIFLDSIQTQDVFLTIEGLRKALLLLLSQNVLPTIFFLRFDRIIDKTNQEFFLNLRGLIDATGQKLSYVFTAYRSLDYFAPEIAPRKLLGFSNIVFMTPANEKDLRVFYNNFEKRFDVIHNDTLLKKITELSGGHFQYFQIALLILNQKMNEKSITPNQLEEYITNDERTTMQSEELWESLQPQEQTVLKKIQKKEVLTEDDRKNARYLWETGIIIEKNNTLDFFTPLFERYIQDIHAPKTKTEVVDLTKKEYQLYSLLLENIGEVCERDTIISHVWPEYEEFGVTDWTIDRLVARVRSKMKKYKQNQEIVTVKTRGYKLVDNS